MRSARHLRFVALAVFIKDAQAQIAADPSDTVTGLVRNYIAHWWEFLCCDRFQTVYPLGSSIFYVAIVDVGDDPRDQVPLQGFKRIYTSRYYAVYGNC